MAIQMSWQPFRVTCQDRTCIKTMPTVPANQLRPPASITDTTSSDANTALFQWEPLDY